jgi:transglutaminase-like putative cysteine protease
MKTTTSPIHASAVLAVALLISPVWAAAEDVPWPPGTSAQVGGKTATLTKLETLPFVESEYTQRFTFDASENPKLKELRERYRLEEVVAAGKDEFERQVLLNDWVHRQFKKFGQPSTKTQGALDILRAIGEGNTFFCAQYADTLVSTAASLGWVDRPLALRRHQGANKAGGSTEHSVTEIWSNQYAKWVMLDPTSNMYLEKDGVPLNAYEIRQEWFYHAGAGLVFVVGKEHKRYRKADLPIVLESFPGFGTLSVEPDELDKYGFTAFVPNTNLMDAGPDYGRMFIIKDQLCDGTKWHERKVPEHPATDPYFPIDEATMELRVKDGTLVVGLRTFCPNFATFEVRRENGEWQATDGWLVWELHPGKNRLEARTVNKFGVAGPGAFAEVQVPE